MTLLTLIGSAAVDYRFREKFLKDPIATARSYGFQLTKFDAYMLTQVFTSELAPALDQKFRELEDVLYQNLTPSAETNAWPWPWPGCARPCKWSLLPPEFKGPEDYERVEHPAAEQLSAQAGPVSAD